VAGTELAAALLDAEEEALKGPGGGGADADAFIAADAVAKSLGLALNRLKEKYKNELLRRIDTGI
jgi:hypothetical protein